MKYLSIALALTAVFALTACEEKKPDAKPDTAKSAAAAKPGATSTAAASGKAKKEEGGW